MKLDLTTQFWIPHYTSQVIIWYDAIESDVAGGVCSYIRNSINYTRRLDLENESLEILALEIRKPNTKPFLVFCWYRPPHSPVEHFEIFESLFKQAEIDYSDIYTTGDINCNLLQDSRDSPTMRLINIMEAYQLTHVISEPTRVTKKFMYFDWPFYYEQYKEYCALWGIPSLKSEKLVCEDVVPGMSRQGILRNLMQMHFF